MNHGDLTALVSVEATMRIFRSRIEDNKVPMDTTPMIDCIFLLLIFFILTSKFTPDEQKLAALLPTDGQAATGNPPPPVITSTIRIAITPAGAPYGASDNELNEWATLARRQGTMSLAELHIGGRDPLQIDLKALSMPMGPELNAQMEAVHRYIADSLTQLEQGAHSRTEASPIEIHCFSGLPWSFAILAYDAVRAYEGEHFPANTDEVKLADARVVNFAPPRIRDYSALEDGKELGEIQRMR